MESFWEIPLNKERSMLEDDKPTFDGIVLGVIAGCVLWSALYLVWQMVVQQ